MNGAVPTTRPRPKRWRRAAGELLGAGADLGVLLPLLFGLALFNGVPFPSTLALVGLLYVGAALFYRLPAPVQPLKAACSLALALGLGRTVLAAAALEMSLLLLLLAATGWAERLAKVFHKWVIRGMQMGVGLILLRGAVTLWRKGAGDLAAGAGPQPWAFPGAEAWAVAFTALVVPQLPVTLSNAVVGSADAARRYFRWHAFRVTASRLCATMGLANLAMGLAGGMPVCHGSSGWTAHRRLGARSMRSTLLLGAALVAVAALMRNDALAVLAAVPVPLLAGVLAYVGLRHALLVWDLRHRPRLLALAVAVGLLSWVTKNPALGLAAGLLLQWTPAIRKESAEPA
jgi:MFS superfamily sulfate permease-like transporter